MKLLSMMFGILLTAQVQASTLVCDVTDDGLPPGGTGTMTFELYRTTASSSMVVYAWLEGARSETLYSGDNRGGVEVDEFDCDERVEENDFYEPMGLLRLRSYCAYGRGGENRITLDSELSQEKGGTLELTFARGRLAPLRRTIRMSGCRLVR